MLKELLDSIRQNSYERLRNPLLGSFAMSWVVCNWRILATLFLGDSPVDARIAAVESLASPYSLAVVPIISAIAYVALMPWLSLLFERLQSLPKNQQRLRKIRAELPLLNERTIVQEQRARLETAKDRVQKDEELKLREREVRVERESADLRDRVENSELSEGLENAVSDLQELRARSKTYFAAIRKARRAAKPMVAELAEAVSEVDRFRDDRLILRADLIMLQQQVDRLIEFVIAIRQTQRDTRTNDVGFTIERVRAPSDGMNSSVEIKEIAVAEGDMVEAGQVVAVGESSKATLEIRARQAGMVSTISLGKGKTVRPGTVVMTIAILQHPDRGGADEEKVPALVEQS